MSELTRREFSELVGAAGVATGAAVTAGVPALAGAPARVVIVGGGAGGATVARRLKASAREIDVTLVEATKAYTSAFLSEHYLGGFRSFNSLTHKYDGLTTAGVTVVHDRAIGVKTAKRELDLKGGTTLAYDKLVLSPGIDLQYDTITGYSPQAAQRIPHGWQTGAQNIALRNQLLDMTDGGTVVMSVPLGPIRGGSAPYTRASMVAHYLKYHKPKSRLVLLDANRDFAQRTIFEEAWKLHYDGIIDHRLSTTPGEFAVVRVDANTLEAETANGDRVKGDVMSLVPEQRAGQIAHMAGCAENNWCPVDPATFESTLVPNVYVLGDAANMGIVPKTAFAANSQGDVVANHLAAELAGKKRFPARLRSTQWPLIATNHAIKSGASYVVGKGEVVEATSFGSQVKEPDTIRARNFEESLEWYTAMTQSIFAIG